MSRNPDIPRAGNGKVQIPVFGCEEVKRLEKHLDPPVSEKGTCGADQQCGRGQLELRAACLLVKRMKHVGGDGVFQDEHPFCAAVGANQIAKRQAYHRDRMAVADNPAIQGAEKGQSAQEKSLKVIVEIEHERFIQPARQDVPDDPEK